MRIISDFRDYYDSVQGQGFDDKVIYRRATRDYVHPGLDAEQRWRTHTGAEVEAVQAEMALLPDFHDFRPRPYAKDHRAWVSSRAEAGMLYLAGRAYPFWRLFAERNGPATTSLEPGFGEHVMQHRKPRRTYSWEGNTTDYTPWTEWLEAHWGREIDPAIHFLHGSPMVLYVGDRRIVDPCLKDHGFQKMLDPFTVFQELDMFLGGVMASAMDPASPQTDKEKIASHGMDVKRSFRNMPRRWGCRLDAARRLFPPSPLPPNAGLAYVQRLMTEHYEDEDASRGRTLSNGQVLAFIARLWLRRPWLLTGAVGLMLVAVVFDLMLPSAAKALIDAVSSPVKDAGRAWGAWGLFVGVYVAFVVTRNIGFRFWNPLAARNMRELTDEAFRKVQSFSSDWHADNFAGATVRKVSRAMWGYDSVSDAVILWLGPALLVLAGLCIQMMFRWPLVGLLAAFVVAGFVWANLWLVKVYVRPTNLKSIALDSRIGGALADAIGSNPTVKTFGAERREEARFGELTNTWHLAVQKTWGRFMDVWVVQNILTVMLQAGSTGILVHMWLQGRATAGDLGFAITAFMLMSGYLRNIGENVRMLQKGLDDAEDVAAYARMPPQVADREGAAAFVPGAGEIVFEGATFQYKSADAPLYDGFSVRIAPGEKVALVGPTGAGKSTFVKLVQRLYDLQGGRILIDGQDVAAVTQGSLRQAIAVVPQDPALFHRTIAENIGYARPGATSEEIRLAAQRARAHDFIERLPNGYQTLVGERGVKLSGGERQRVAIARAFLADAPILVFDEATSSLDVETEREVQAAMEELMAGRTTIVIAHRLSTIRGADRILVFENGRVVEEGTHGTLKAKQGMYARLAALAEGTA